MSKTANIGAVFVGVLLIIMLAACGSGDEVKLIVRSCDAVARGEVKNTTDHTLEVWVAVDFVDHKGNTVYHGSEIIDYLEAGQARDWSVSYGGVRNYDTCKAEVILAIEPAPPIIEPIEIP